MVWDAVCTVRELSIRSESRAHFIIRMKMENILRFRLYIEDLGRIDKTKQKCKEMEKKDTK